MKTICVLLALLTPCCGQAVAVEKPNIIVILTDDLGYADLSVQGQQPDIRTPHIDSIAHNGVRFTDGYITAPQCSPSRAGLITGRYQQRFGLEAISECPMPADEVTLAERLKPAGYTTGFVGKWHLDVSTASAKWFRANGVTGKAAREQAMSREKTKAFQPESQGFDEVFDGLKDSYFATYDLQGNDIPGGRGIQDERFRVDVQTDAALAFMKRHKDKPFFLHLCYFAPHVPLEADKKYLDRFPGKMPERRRMALAMMSAVDDGVGRILASLKEAGVADNTLIFFTSDNGAPLHGLKDAPLTVKGGAWDGSLNTPWRGEKGMLSEGGIRVPFLMQWPARIAGGKIYRQPVISLDIVPTVLAAAGLASDAPELDGTNLLPFLDGSRIDAPHDALFWRFQNQAAIRQGDWKLLLAGNDVKLLFNLTGDAPEKTNLAEQHPQRVLDMEAMLRRWSRKLKPVGLPAKPFDPQRSPEFHREFLAPKADALVPESAAKRPPNIVLILADDLGYGDVGAFVSGQSPTLTPRLDRLASEGVRFADCILPANVCSPSRAAILTGRYPQRCGVPVAVNPDEKHARYGLSPEETTLAEVLKDRGYATACIGKWHLGRSEEHTPHAAGFDHFHGLMSNLQHDTRLFENGKVVDASPDPNRLTKDFTRQAITFLQQNKDQPFFLYLPHIAVHGPLVPAPEFQGKSGMGRYEDFVMELDARCGELLDAIAGLGLEKNTVVVFLSDNGSVRRLSNAPFRGTKYTTMEGGHRTPLIMRFPGVLPAGRVVTETISSMDLFPTIAALADAKLPSDRILDGVNLLPSLTQRQTLPERTLLYYNGTNLQAVRQGRWKLHLPRAADDQPWWASGAGPKKEGFFRLDTPRLFDLGTDMTEKVDVSASQPTVMAQLIAAAETARKELGDTHVAGSDSRHTGLRDVQKVGRNVRKKSTR